MDRDPARAPLSVAEAKSRLRLAAAQAEPTVMMTGAMRASPLQGVILLLVAGMLLGASPGLRRTVGALLGAGLASAAGRRLNRASAASRR